MSITKHKSYRKAILYFVLGFSFLISFLFVSVDKGGDASILEMVNSLLSRVLIEDLFGLTGFFIPLVLFYFSYLNFKQQKVGAFKNTLYLLTLFNIFFFLNIFLMNFKAIWNSHYAGFFPKLVHTLIVSAVGKNRILVNFWSVLLEFLLVCGSVFLFFSVFERQKMRSFFSILKRSGATFSSKIANFLGSRLEKEDAFFRRMTEAEVREVVGDVDDLSFISNIGEKLKPVDESEGVWDVLAYGAKGESETDGEIDGDKATAEFPSDKFYAEEESPEAEKKGEEFESLPVVNKTEESQMDGVKGSTEAVEVEGVFSPSFATDDLEALGEELTQEEEEIPTPEKISKGYSALETAIPVDSLFDDHSESAEELIDFNIPHFTSKEELKESEEVVWDGRGDGIFKKSEDLEEREEIFSEGGEDEDDSLEDRLKSGTLPENTQDIRAKTPPNFTSSEAEETPEKSIAFFPMVINETNGFKSQVRGNLRNLLLPEKMQDSMNPEHLRKMAEVLESTFKDFGVGVKVVKIVKGPVVTQYQIAIDSGVKVSRVLALSDNIALGLSAFSVRISNIPGKGVLGIEVPNRIRQKVTLREIMEDRDFNTQTKRLPIALGKSIVGGNVVKDFAEMPHLLVAGATGSGKSVCINGIITSLITACSPEELRLIMVDPKMVELTVYNGIPHLLTPVITQPEKASTALKWLIGEMEMRYRLLERCRVRSIKSYNDLCAEDRELRSMPYVMLIIDEFADLMMVARKDVEDSISRLAAMSRAVGIHLLVATQRPSVDVITGVIKANFPSRIAFQVASKIDSRTILDESGAEQLLGKGDMLFSDAKSMSIDRMQCGFLSDGEVSHLTDELRKMSVESDLTKLIFKSKETSSEGVDDEDEIFEKAVEIVVSSNKASASYLQRRLKIGYNRAARIIEKMEERGIVTANEGAKGRTVLIN